MKIDLEILRRDISNKETEDYLNEHSELQKWLMMKGEETKAKYIRHLLRYVEILYKNELIPEKSPNGLLELARRQTEEDKPHVEILEEFQISCEEILPEDKRAIIFSVSICVKSFYNFKGYIFPRFRGSYDYSPKEKESIPTLQDIIPSMDSVKHIRTKTVIALESSAPLRMGSLLNLRWKHFKELLEGKTLPMVKLESTELKGKGKRRYAGIKQICFLTPFSASHILRYKHWYEQRTGKEVSLANPENLELKFLITDKGEPISYSGLNTSFEIAKKMGYNFRLHIWRTVVNEALMKARMSKEHRDVVLGHKQTKVEKAYTFASELREEFRDAVKYLDPTYKEDEKIVMIREKVKELKGVEVSDSEARQILDTVLMKFFSSSK